VGYDRDANIFIVTDTERRAPCSVPIESMRKARSCFLGLFIVPGNRFSPGSLSIKDDLKEIGWNAITRNSLVLLEDPSGSLLR
jgi:hypothetical protein